MTASVATEARLSIDGHHLSPGERYVAHGALLAQTDNAQADGVHQWTKRDYEAALAVLSALTGEVVGADPLEGPSSYGESASSRVLVIALLVPVYDLDHPDLEPEEWAEAERLLAVLASEFGR